MSPDTIGELTGLFAISIPIAAIVLGIGLSAWSLHLEHQRKRLQYQERQLMIERGMTPPPELPTESKNGGSPEYSLRRGTVMVFLGLGFGVAYLLLPGNDGPPPWLAGVAGAIVGFVGLGNLVYYFIARNKDGGDSSRPM